MFRSCQNTAASCLFFVLLSLALTRTGIPSATDVKGGWDINVTGSSGQQISIRVSSNDNLPLQEILESGGKAVSEVDLERLLNMQPIRGFIAIGPTGDPQIAGMEFNTCELPLTESQLLSFRQPGEDDNPMIKTGDLETGVSVSDIKELAEYHSHPVYVGEPAIMRGIRVVPVRIHPVSFDEENSSIIVRTSGEVTLEISTGIGTNPELSRTPPAAGSFIDLSNSVIFNNPAPSRDAGIPIGGSFLYIIPENGNAAELLAPLIEWRRRSGSYAVVQEVSGNREDILDVIQTAYDEWEYPPEHVVLVGDADGDNSLEAWQDVVDPVSDYGYTLIDGDDFLPDLAIGRLSWDDDADLERIVGKIVSYESQPTLDESDWYLHGVSCTSTNDENSTQILVGRWIYQRMIQNGYEVVDTSYMAQGNQFHNFLLRSFNDGTSLISTRSMSGWDNNAAPDLNNDPELPFFIMSCGNSARFWRANQVDDGAEALIRSPGGIVGGVGGSNQNTRTAYANLFSGGIIQGLLIENIREFGWALQRGRLELYLQYAGLSDDPFDNDSEWWEAHVKMFNLIGDPGTSLWVGVPGEMEVEFENRMQAGANIFHITVTDANADEPLQDALVCLYNEEGLFLTNRTDAEGFAFFSLPRENRDLDSALLTVTREGFAPVLDEIEFGEGEFSIGYSGMALEDNGDEDGNPDYSETLALHVTLFNFGGQAGAGPLTVELASRSPFLEIDEGNVEVDDSIEPGDSTVVDFQVTVTADCPDQASLFGEITVTDAEDRVSTSSFEMTAGAPLLATGSIRFPGGGLVPGEAVEMNVEIVNSGTQALDPCAVEIVEPLNLLRIIQGEGSYDIIGAGEASFLAGELFTVQPNPVTIPGMRISLEMRITAESGRRDTLRFNVNLEAAQDGDPFGPDDYGYACFDSEDRDWELAPEFNWIEIDPNRGGEGDNLGIENLDDNDHQAVLVDLPFAFTYYGREYDQITVCSSGWIAPGDQTEFVDFRNRRLPSPLGPTGKICVFWDNLSADQNSGVYGDYLDEAGLYVVEWSRLYHKIDGGGRGQLETFELVIFNPDVHPTFSGDAHIMFQYLQVTDSPEGFDWDTPYATVGIEGFETGQVLQYCYWNEYPDGATRLTDELAILFTTNIYFISGVLAGTVSEIENHQPLEGVLLRLNNGMETTSDDLGSFRFEGLLVGLPVVLTARLAGYNDWVSDAIEMEEAVEIVIEMTHPEFVISDESVDLDLYQNEIEVVSISIRNEGNGPLEFTTELEQVAGGAARDDPWDRLLEINATDTTGDQSIQCAAWVGDQFMVAGSNNNDEPNLFYLFDRNGCYTGSVEQSYPDDEGARGLAFDGELLWMTGDAGVTAQDLEGNQAIQFDGYHNFGRGIAVDPENRTVYLSSVLDDNADVIAHMDAEGNLIETIPTRYEVYGLSWYPEDPDGCHLYLTGTAEPGGAVYVIKMNPETGDEVELRQISREIWERASGSEITGSFRFDLWTMVTILRSPRGDQMIVHELGPRTSWIRVEPREAVVQADEQLPINVTFDTNETIPGDYGARLTFLHNALPGEFQLPIWLHVLPDTVNVPETTIPEIFEIGEVFPNPFNSSANISVSLPQSGFLDIKIHDLTGREISAISERKFRAGRREIHLDGSMLRSGVYIIGISNGSEICYRKFVVLK